MALWWQDQRPCPPGVYPAHRQKRVTSRLQQACRPRGRTQREQARRPGPDETRDLMTRERIGVLAGVAVIAAIGIGVGVAVAAGGPSGRPGPAGATAGPGYSWYHSMMGRYTGRSMMGGPSGGWMMGPAGYRWMMGGTGAPGWMRGGSLPSSMMGTTTDPGKIMGRLWASAPGPRVSAAPAVRLGKQVPAGASVNKTRNTIAFTTASIHLAVV